MDSQCSTYCYSVVEPMLKILNQCQVKDDEIKLLKDELADLRQQLAVHKEREANNKELLSLTSRLDGLSKQIEQLSNTRKEELKLEEEKKLEKEGERKREQEKQTERAHICSHDEGFSSWQVIQRRRGQDSSPNFYRPWRDYRNGFGDTNSSFFIGLEKLHQLTKKQPHELIVRMQHFNEIVRYARYDNFAIGSEGTQYQLLSLGRHSGNASDAMRRSETMKFTTLDRDNDKHNFSNCAQINQDAWWHAACSDWYVRYQSPSTFIKNSFQSSVI